MNYIFDNLNELKIINEPFENIQTRMITQIYLTENYIINNTRVTTNKNHDDNTLNISLYSKECTFYNEIRKLCEILTVFLSVKNNISINERILNMKNVFYKKNSDYGSSYKHFGIVGLVVRLKDKIHRFNTLNKNNCEANYESIDDTLEDLNLYCVIILSECLNMDNDSFIKMDSDLD
jgi:hypothetical protein